MVTEEEIKNLSADNKEVKDRILSKYPITDKESRGHIRQVAEGAMDLNEKFDSKIAEFRQDVAHSHE